jgi:signal peptidase I
MSKKPVAAPEPAFKKSVAREYLESIVVAVILALFIRTFAVQAFKIPTGSMEDTLLIGDHLLVNKLVYSPSRAPWEDELFGKKPIRRGDVVVFKYPVTPSRDFIKRVIGLPGETIEVRNKKVYINGNPLDEDVQICAPGPGGERTCQDAAPSADGPYKVYFFTYPPSAPEEGEQSLGWGESCGDNCRPQVIPSGSLALLGDNRDNSADSRVWGFLPIDQVKGRALLIYWSVKANRQDYQESGLRAWLKVLDPREWRWRRFFRVIR